MWDIFLKNLPMIIIALFATIICGAEFIKALKVWKEERKTKIDKALEEKQEKIDIQNEFESMHEKLDEIILRLNNNDSRMESAEQKLQDLIASDMHDIKAWIVEQYRIYYIEQGWIDAFHAETIDRRYEDYLKEGGNHYIHTLMERIHTLPMDPPDLEKKDKNE